MANIKHVKLSNGGNLYYVKNNINKSTNVEVSFDCGARCDTIPGLAHFAEHMFFAGTKTMSRAEINKKYFNFIGSNAYTSNNVISFEAMVFTKEFKEYIKTVSMLVTESVFNQNEIDKEYDIIKQEIARKKDKQSSLAWSFNTYNLTNENSYKDYGALGTEESISTIKTKDIKNFVKKYFLSNNLIVYVTTTLSLKKVKSIIEKELVTKLQINENFKKLPKFSKYAKNTNFLNVKTKDIGKNYIYINFVNNHNAYDLKYSATKALVFDMINDISAGMLKLLREEKSLVYSASVNTEITNDKHSVETFYTECATKNVNEVIKTFAEYIKNICLNGFTESQFKQARRMFKYNQETRQPTVAKLMSSLFRFEFYDRNVSKELKKLKEKVTLQDCNNLFKEMFKTDMVSVSVYGEITNKELIKNQQFKSLFLK